METQSLRPAGELSRAAQIAPPSNETRRLHSFQDLPVSVVHVSTGPLGGVARRDHT